MSLSTTSTSSFFSHAATPPHFLEKDLPADLISFLAIAQNLKIDFLPIRWEPALEELGEGGTAKIGQSLVNLRLSFAFKRISFFSEVENDRARTFRALISEISILGHPSIRYHQNVVRLEGICWDFPNEDQAVNPVLVFEKARYGDLEKFSESKAGRDMPFKDRLNICANVANAVLVMHSCGIIHRDIKPQNVLMFKDISGSYVAKVADYGYSIRTAGDNVSIKMPYSRLWNAPEWHDRGFRPSEGKKSDAYSFGLVCLWFLFKESFSRIIETPNHGYEMEDGNVPFTELHEGPVIQKFLLESKSKGMLLTLSRRLMAVAGLDDEHKSMLYRFFESTLECNAAKRCSDFDELLGLLGRNSVALPTVAGQIEDYSQLYQTQFRVAASLNQLCQADYRVRSQIYLHLTQNVSQPTNKAPIAFLRNAAFQLAFCYRLGFGVAKDDIECRTVLRKSMRSWEELQQEIELVKYRQLRSPFQAGNFREMYYQGQIKMDFAQCYREHGLLANIELKYRREIADMTSVLGDCHPIIVLLKSTLSKILGNQGRLDESEELKAQVVETSKMTLGEEHPDTLISMNNMSIAYRDKGKWNQAEDLLLQTMRLSKRIPGLDNSLSRLDSVTTLAAILFDQGRWKEALKMQTEVVQIEIREFGQSHPKTLNGIGNLAATLWNLGMWKRARKLETQVLETSEKVLGSKHPGTLTSMRNLALTFKEQGQWKQAEDMQIRVLKLSKQILGPDHPQTLSNTTNLAATFWSQGRWSEAEDLENQALKIKKRVLGPKHPNTLMSMANLSATLRDLGFWKKAEALKVEVRDLSVEVLGPEHPDTLISMGNLAVSYRDRKQHKAAEELQQQVLDLSRKVYGPDHAFTLSSMINLAATFLDQKRYKEAIKLNTQAMKVRAKVLGSEHPATLNSMGNLAAIFSGQRRWEEAEKLEVQVLEIRKRVLGPEHPATLTSIANLGTTYDSLGRVNEALELHQEALDLRRKVLGEDHEDTISSLEWIRVLSSDLPQTIPKL